MILPRPCYRCITDEMGWPQTVVVGWVLETRLTSRHTLELARERNGLNPHGAIVAIFGNKKKRNMALE